MLNKKVRLETACIVSYRVEELPSSSSNLTLQSQAHWPTPSAYAVTLSPLHPQLLLLLRQQALRWLGLSLSGLRLQSPLRASVHG